MLTKKNLHDYQNQCVDFIFKNPKCGLFLHMGLGKTITTLTALKALYDDCLISRVLIVAPLRVANNVWAQEAAKWEHTADMKINVCTGSALKRSHKLMDKTAQICVINWENLAWLIKSNHFDFDAVVIDESSKFKNHRSLCFRAIKSRIKKLNSIILLTGTPSPRSYVDLWSQIFLIDGGVRLGKTVGEFRRIYCEQEGYMGYSWTIRDGKKEILLNKISDVTLSMVALDKITMPELINIDVVVSLDNKKMIAYKKLEKEFLLEIGGERIDAASAGVLAGKLLQFCNGAVYSEDGKYQEIHDEKIIALKDMIDGNETENFLVAYNYRHDRERLLRAFPDAKELNDSTIESWNDGKIKMMIAHPASAGHGLNLQSGGNNVVWFGLNWSLELYEQFNARLYRQGQKNTVKISHIIMQGGIDEKLMGALQNKIKNQKELFDYLKKI